MCKRNTSMLAAVMFAIVVATPAAAQLSGMEIRIGIGAPLTTGSATFGVEMRQAIDLAIAERNAAGGLLGAKLVAEVQIGRA